MLKMDRIVEIEKVAKLIAEDATADIESMKPKVFIMGPNIKDKQKPGSILRRKLAQRCWNEGLPITTEHPALEAGGSSGLGEGFDLTTWELYVAKNSELIIIIPDSPGSFAELGLFSTRQKTCPRTIILFDKQHKGKRKSFIFRGPRKAAKRRGAKIHFVDYTNIDNIWEKVTSYIKLAKEVMAGKHL